MWQYWQIKSPTAENRTQALQGNFPDVLSCVNHQPCVIMDVTWSTTEVGCPSGGNEVVDDGGFVWSDPGSVRNTIS